MSQIDSIDERILAELQANGRLTMKALAERVGLSSPAMIERVRRLEERGVIIGYRSIVAPGALGRPVMAFVSVRASPERQKALAQLIDENPGIVEAHRVTGAMTHLLKVHVSDMAALEQLSDALGGLDAACEIQVVLSSPMTWRGVTSPEGSSNQRTRLTRRKRRSTSTTDDQSETSSAPPKRRGPGRPRTVRTTER